LVLRGIATTAGRLVQRSLDESRTFQKYCNDTKLSVDGTIVSLTASCRLWWIGWFRNSSLVLNGIENINGDLKY
jgi:hypothetical protein